MPARKPKYPFRKTNLKVKLRRSRADLKAKLKEKGRGNFILCPEAEMVFLLKPLRRGKIVRAIARKTVKGRVVKSVVYIGFSPARPKIAVAFEPSTGKLYTANDLPSEGEKNFSFDRELIKGNVGARSFVSELIKKVNTYYLKKRRFETEERRRPKNK